jgi:hypothetical protein
MSINKSFVMLLSLSLCVVGCDKPAAPDAEGSRSTAAETENEPTPAQLDTEMAELMRAPDTTEARQWLDPKADKHMLWKTWDKPEARKQVEAIYTAGAKKVWVADPTDMNGVQVAAQLVIELPEDAKKRAAVFGWIHDWEEQIEDEKPTKDVGQKYYEINLDL